MRERGVGIFSVTDHDTLAAYPGVFEPAAPARVVVGIEINTTYRGSEVHVLGYRLPLGTGVLTDLLETNRIARDRRVEVMVAQLQAHGYPITVEGVRAAAGVSLVLGRPHVGAALVRAGIVPDIETAFRNLLARGKPGYVPSHHITPQVAINVIKRVGGIAVLAHPGRLRDLRIIDEMAGLGLSGIEVFYPKHDAEQIAFFRQKAAQHGLLMSAGSDFHDPMYNPHGVGMDVERADIQPFLDVVLA